MQSIPDGFKPLPIGGGFVQANGPLYGRREPDGAIVLGFTVEERHCNFRGVCHGGMLMTFVDMVLTLTVNAATGGRKFLPTMNVTTDFVGPAALGAWIEGRARTLRVSRNFAFADCELSSAGVLVARANGILKVPAEENAGLDIDRLF